MIRFACPACMKVYKVPDRLGGKAASCTRCGGRFLIPDPPSVTELERPVVPPPPPAFRQPLEAELVEDEVPVPPAPPSSSVLLPALSADVLDAELVEARPPAPPPPPPPPPSRLIIPRELEPCPRCTAVNSVASEYVGQPIECPFCQTVYLGVARRPPPPPAPVYIPVPMFGPPQGGGYRGGYERNFSSYWSRPMTGEPLPPPPLPSDVIVFSPPPPAAPEPILPHPPTTPKEVDIAPCPKCRAELSVTADVLGGPVECPFCQTVYLAEPPKPKDGTLLARVVRRTKAEPPKEKKPYRFWWNSTGTGGGDDPWPKGREG